ncbi:hypothetical protein ACFWHQ_37905 [Streptomyces sp. NPDC060334]|uniref:hypothetical protein n=1 Tax=unclassified Streptomyces TaxID=2593676 RepID=UPI0036674740
MGNKVVTLPESPKGEELEDYIAALFQASGNFVEKQIIERDPADILELDIFSTNYGPEQAVRRLIEVKSGRWGSPTCSRSSGGCSTWALSTGPSS